MERVAQALGGDDASGALYDLIERIGAPNSLKEIGMKAEDLDKAAEIATTNPYYNPRPVTKDGIRALLEDAFQGRRPGPAARLSAAD